MKKIVFRRNLLNCLLLGTFTITIGLYLYMYTYLKPAVRLTDDFRETNNSSNFSRIECFEEINSTNSFEFDIDSPRVGVVAHVPFRPDLYFNIQFAAMLYSSWKYINNHTYLANKTNIRGYNLSNSLIISDMLVWCAAEACKWLPKDCIKYQFPYQPNLEPQCLYFVQEEHPNAKNNGWLNSFQYVFDPNFYDLTEQFDYFLRLDSDTLLAPGFLVFIPQNDVAIGEGFYCTDFNKNRLEQIAKKLNLRNQQVHCIGSSWYAKASKAQQLGAHAFNLTSYLHANEFKPNLPGLEGLFNQSADGIWPTWWRGVSLLYGCELALNSMVDNLNDSWARGLFDQRTCKTEISVMSVVQLHSYHDPCQFQKFEFVEAMISMRSSKTLDPRLHLFHADRSVENMSLRDYSIFISWNGAGKYVPRIRTWLMSSLNEKYVDD